MTELVFPKKAASPLPKGTSVLLPEAAARQRRIEARAREVFRRWGYREVIPPLFEDLEAISRSLDASLVEKSYKFVDRATGRVMLLRPDVTPQIARMVALLMGAEARPIRLCYSANVFRYEEEHAGREREILQIGAELVGPQDEEADAEIIALLVEVLRAVGLSDFRVAVGHVGLLEHVFEALSLGETDRVQVQKALLGRNANLLEQVVGARLTALLDLFGQQGVIDRARRLLDECGLLSREAGEALSRLDRVYHLVRLYGLGDHVLLDLSEVRGFGYYSGIVFEVFAAGAGYDLGGGGRYDHLIEKFGEDVPSTGFALHVERLRRLLDQRPPGPPPGYPDVLLIDPEPDSGTGIAACLAMRQKGLSVIRWPADRPVVDRMLKGRHCTPPEWGDLGAWMRRAANTVLLEPGRQATGRPARQAGAVTAVWIDQRSGTRRRTALHRLIQQLTQSGEGKSGS